ncbi:unnamed protein product, partial [Adineta steineri]
MSQWNQSQKYFEHLLNDNINKDDLPWIEHSLGQINRWKGNWLEAKEYYNHAYDRMMKDEVNCEKNCAIILCDIGEILHLQGKYEEAYEYHEKALTIRKKYYPSFDHPHIATSLENIGLIYYQQLKYKES